MKLFFLKIDGMSLVDGFQILSIPPGGIQITDGVKTIANNELIDLKINVRRFVEVTKDYLFDVYYGNEIEPRRKEKHTLINLLAVENFVNEIYKKMEMFE